MGSRSEGVVVPRHAAGGSLRDHGARRSWDVWTACGLAMFFSLALLAGAAAIIYEEIAFEARGVVTEATVISVEPGDPPWGDVSYETSGPLARAHLPLPDDARVGDRVRVFYDPSDPSQARRDGWEYAWSGMFWALFLLVPGVWAGGWALSHWHDTRRRPTSRGRAG
jgi:hypothetical protein